MTGFLNIRQAAAFLGGRSVSWLRSHLHEIPHRKLYDRLLFDPAELRAFVEKNAKQRGPANLDALLNEIAPRRQERGRRAGVR
jgi:hypothetical protein